MQITIEKSLWQAQNLDLTGSLNRLYNQFIDWLVFLRERQISIKYIAYVINLSERQAQRLINELVKRGLIYKKQVGGKRARNTYSLNREIFKYAKYYQHIFPALKKFVFSVLGWVFGKDVTLYKKNKDINSNISSVHPNLFINSCEWSPTQDRRWSIGYQNSIFNLNGEFERSIPSDHQLENFKKILEESEKEGNVTPKEELFWDGLTKVLKLSQHGLIKLQVFPATVVNSSYKKLQQQTKVHDKVKWLIKECDNQCKKEGRAVAWGKYYDNLRSLGIDQNSSLVEEEQTDFLDFSKPVQPKEPEVYSNRDFSKYKPKITIESVKKGLDFLGNWIPEDMQQNIRQFIAENQQL